MNYKEAYAWGVELLEKACVEESKIDAWYLLEYVTKISRAVFYAYPEKELTEEEKMEAQATFMNPEGDITTSADTYFKTMFPLLQQLKNDCLSNNNPVFEAFYDRNSDKSITGTEKNFVKVYADIDKINAVSVPAGLGNINTVIKSYVNTVQDCCQLSIDSANGKITPEETATKVKALADQRRNTSYDYADMVYKYFQSVDVLWESVYGDYILDLLS